MPISEKLKGKLKLNSLACESDSDIADDEKLEELLNLARASLAKSSATPVDVAPKKTKLPRLDPGPELPKPYFKISTSKTAAPTLERDPDSDELAKIENPKPPSGAPELNASGRPITKRERRESRRTTAGPEWFDLPAPEPNELPELYKQVEALRLRRAMDPRAHVKKDAGEKKGIKGLPKYFAIGKVIDSPTPFKTRNTSNLTRRERKRTLVEELVADSQARSYAKRKFAELAATKHLKSKDNAFKRQRKW